jgi:hypothetical protein
MTFSAEFYISGSKMDVSGNTTLKCQNNATLVSRDSGNARNGFYRSKGTYRCEFDQVLHNTSVCE